MVRDPARQQGAWRPLRQRAGVLRRRLPSSPLSAEEVLLDTPAVEVQWWPVDSEVLQVIIVTPAPALMTRLGPSILRFS